MVQSGDKPTSLNKLKCLEVLNLNFSLILSEFFTKMNKKQQNNEKPFCVPLSCCRQHIVVTVCSVQGDCPQPHFLLGKKKEKCPSWNSSGTAWPRCRAGASRRETPRGAGSLTNAAASFTGVRLVPFCLSHSFIQKKKKIWKWKFPDRKTTFFKPLGCFYQLSSFSH